MKRLLKKIGFQGNSKSKHMTMAEINKAALPIIEKMDKFALLFELPKTPGSAMNDYKQLVEFCTDITENGVNQNNKANLLKVITKISDHRNKREWSRKGFDDFITNNPTQNSFNEESIRKA
jgi:hypothetical protein